MTPALGDLVQVIRDADSADKADLCAQLGLSMTYRPQKRLVEATVTPSLHMCKGFVSEDRHNPLPHIAPLTTALKSAYKNTAPLSTRTSAELRELLIHDGRK